MKNLSRRTRVITGVALAAGLVAGGAVAYAQSGGGKASKGNEVVVLNTVQRRTLQSTVALNGTFARKELSKVTAATQGLMSAVYAKDGTTTQAGQTMFTLNGRAAIAEDGTLPFFRSLGLGDEGDDVVQLKRILAAAGDRPGPLTPLFTLQTQSALALWQAQHHYPSSTPASPQSLTVSLQPGTGYKLGDQGTAGLIIGPPSAQTAGIVLSSVRPHDATPVLTIQAVDDQVPQGSPATFVITASASSSGSTTVNLSSGGSAGSDDIVTPPSSVVLPANATSVSVMVQTRVTNTVEPDRSIVLSIDSGSGYAVGSPDTAQTRIKNSNVPSLQITGSTTVSPGGAATLTINADQAPLQDTQVELSLSGSAVSGTDYDPVDPVITLGAGNTSASVTFHTISNSAIEPDRYIVVSISPSPANYSVGSQGTAVVTIGESSAVPTIRLSSATNYLQKGEPYQVTATLSQALSNSLTLDLSYGGTAVEGVDYTTPAGILAVPAGQTSLSIAIPTVTDNLVEGNRTLTVSLTPEPSYHVGGNGRVSVTITSAVVPQITIAVNTPTVAQGGTATFVITASEAVAQDTSVNFSAQGTAQPGQDYVPLAGTVILRAGQTVATVVLQTSRTDVEFEPTDMIVGQWPTRVGQVFVKAGAPVTPGEAILSLTAPQLTVTLQASAANDTLLKVGQHCTVQIAGATTTASGTITELDSTPTNITSATPGGASSQVYEGTIEVADLSGADGSAVSINVVDQQVDNALTVPIAAVEQNGTGADVVRVIDRRSSKVTDVRVTTGLTEGSYIQVTRGLQLGQTVIVQVDHPQ